MKIGLVVNETRDQELVFTQMLLRAFQSEPLTWISDPKLQSASLFSDGRVLPQSYEECDWVLCIGGDGTLLEAARRTFAYSLPIAGINLGSMGFMMEIERTEAVEAVRAIVSKNCTVSQHLLLSVSCYDFQNEEKWSTFAVNDVVLSRAPFSRIVTYGLSLDGETVESIPGDGLIVSSPLGSTGYALAAGGAILDPRLEAMEIMPLCPHTLHNRSYVVHASAVVDTWVESADQKVFVAVDGRAWGELGEGMRLKIRRGEKTLPLIRLSQKSNFVKIPEKINRRAHLNREVRRSKI